MPSQNYWLDYLDVASGTTSTTTKLEDIDLWAALNINLKYPLYPDNHCYY